MSLKIASSAIRNAIQNGVPATGPPSLRSRWARLRYRSPAGLDEAFSEAQKVLSAESARLGELAARAEGAEREKLEALRDVHNPEVVFNFLVKSKEVSLDLPVYKRLAQREWARKPMLVLMQRLEQHHVIPDTMPTLDPRADVQLQFDTPSLEVLSPGEVVGSAKTSRLPNLEVRDYSLPAGTSAKYTVAIVNPDAPNLEQDTYQPYLHFLATNVEASLASPKLNFSKDSQAVPYVAPHPEKNGPTQRLCVWVFRQSGEVKADVPARLGFDLRAFAKQHGLDAVGATLWRSKWDVNTDAVRAKYGLPRGNVYFRARTAHPDRALLHVRERPKWMRVDGLQE